jgi:hypothetical protein
MSAEMTSPQTEHAPRRARSPRATSRPKDQVAERPRKVSFYLSADACRRLGVAASMEDTDKSRVVERLIRDGLKRWVIADRAKPAGQLDLAGEEDRASAA